MIDGRAAVPGGVLTQRRMRLRQGAAGAEGRQGQAWDLSQATGFLLVAATLLDVKASRLLPTSSAADDEEDVALLEARDLLFARLLQYLAFKEVADWFAGRLAGEGRSWPRQPGPEPRFAALLPELVLGIGPTQFARVAAQTMAPRTAPTVSLDHLHLHQADAFAQPRIRWLGAQLPPLAPHLPEPVDEADPRDVLIQPRNDTDPVQEAPSV